MRYILTLLLLLTLNSCGIYNLETRYSQPEIKSVLAVTSEGDTIQVSTDYLTKEFRYNSPQYTNWRFYWDNSWYWGNSWYNLYDPYWRLRVYRYNPYRVNPRIRVPRKVEVPQRYRTPNRVRSATPRGSNTPRVQPNRGRSNQPTRTPSYNRPTRQINSTVQKIPIRTSVGRTKNN